MFDKTKTLEERLEINAIFFMFFDEARYDSTELKLSASYELIAAEAARVAGINVAKYQTIVYIISAVMAATAGILISCRTATGEPLLGDGYESDAIAATVMGGTILDGGVGTLGGTIIGVLIIGIITALSSSQ